MINISEKCAALKWNVGAEWNSVSRLLQVSPLRRIAIYGLTLMVLTSCQTTGGDSSAGYKPDQPNYNIFYTPVDHLEELLAAGKLKEADNVFRTERAAFIKSDDKYKGASQTRNSLSFLKTLGGGSNAKSKAPSYIRLAKAVSEQLQPRADHALEALSKGAVWPVDISKWREIETGIENAKDVLSDYDGYSVFNEKGLLPDKSIEIKTKLQSLTASITGSKEELLKRHNLLDQPNLITAYPLKEERSGFLDGKADLWLDKIQGFSAAELASVFNNYKGWLSDTIKAEMGDKHFSLVLDELSVTKKASFQDIMTAYRRTETAGMPIGTIPESKVALIEVTSRTLLQQDQIEFPVAINLNLPIKAEKAELDQAFDSEVAKSADILVLIDVSAARTDREITSYEKVSSEFQSGTRTLPNPDYQIAQNVVNNARLGVQQAAMNKMSVDSQFCQGVGCLGKLAAQIAAIAAESDAQKNLENAMSNLQGTSMTIEEPVYTKYGFSKASIDSAKEATVNYYVIDRVSGRYMKDDFEARQSRSFKVAYKIHSQDRYLSSHLSTADKEEDVIKFEDGEVSVDLSDIFDHYVENTNKHRPLVSLESIRKEVLRNKNKALSEYKKRQFTTVKDDPRFEQVVVVYTPGGSLGTGFFVTDDLVLTNYHVIEGSQFVEMKLHSGQETFGKVIAKDIRLDLALIKAQARGTPVRFYKQNQLSLGKTVEAIGHPSGLEFTITRGVVSAVRYQQSKYMPGGKKVRVVQTDTAINPGNSGGPLYLGDQVVGVNVNKLAATVIEGLSFSIHYSEVLNFLKKNSVSAGG